MWKLFTGAGLALIGVLFGFSFATSADVEATAKWWELLTAFATLFAVVAAVAASILSLWLFNRDRAHRLEEQDVLATIVAARMGIRCLHLLSQVHNVEEMAIRGRKADPARSAYHLTIERRFSEISFDVSLEELTLLASMPDHCARRLAEILEALSILENAVRVCVNTCQGTNFMHQADTFDLVRAASNAVARNAAAVSAVCREKAPILEEPIYIRTVADGDPAAMKPA